MEFLQPNLMLSYATRNFLNKIYSYWKSCGRNE